MEMVSVGFLIGALGLVIVLGLGAVFYQFFTGQLSRGPRGSGGGKVLLVAGGVVLGVILLVVLPSYPKLLGVLSIALSIAYGKMLSSKMSAVSPAQYRPQKADSPRTMAIGLVIILLYAGYIAYAILFT